MQLTLGTFVVQIWSRNPQTFEVGFGVSGYGSRIRVQGWGGSRVRGKGLVLSGFGLKMQGSWYPISGEGVKFDTQKVLGRSKGPTVGRMRILAT